MDRPSRTRTTLVPFTLALFASAVGGCRAGGQTMNGTYTIALPEGSATLSLSVLPSGHVSGWMRSVDGTLFQASGWEVIDDEGDTTVEGTLTGAMSADFSFFEEADPEFGLLLTPHDAAGVPQLAAAAFFSAMRASSEAASAPEGNPTPASGAPIVSPATPPPDAAPGSIDPTVVGVWSTQVVMNSEFGSIATQMLMQFGADGVMTDLGSRAIGSVGNGSLDTGLSGGGEQVLWHTQDDLILVSYPGTPAAPLARYSFSEGRLVLRYFEDNSMQIWSRVQ